MGKRILLPVDESEQVAIAAECAADLFPDGTMVLLHVINPADAGYSSEAAIPGLAEGWYEQRKNHAEELFDEVDEQMAAHGIETEHHLELGQPANSIVTLVENEDIDHVVMGSHGRKGVSRVLLGSVAETVVRRSPVPVTVARKTD